MKTSKTGGSPGTSEIFLCLNLVYVNFRKFCGPGNGVAGREILRKKDKR